MEFRIPRTAESPPSPEPSGRGSWLRDRVPRPAPAGRLPDLAYPVKAYFDRFPVQHAVPAVDELPHADGTQLRRGYRGLDAETVQVLEIVVGHEPGMAAGRGVRWGTDLIDGPILRRSVPLFAIVRPPSVDAQDPIRSAATVAVSSP
jgi:hypothetical protein